RREDVGRTRFHCQNNSLFAARELWGHSRSHSDLRFNAARAAHRQRVIPLLRDVHGPATGDSAMKLAKPRKPQDLSDGQSRAPQGDAIPAREMQTLPAVIAGSFTRLHLRQRVRMLRRLLLPVGPMALAVLGGGAFAKYAAQARWPRMSISFEDA